MTTQLTDETLRQAAQEASYYLDRQMPSAGECGHEFSLKFQRKMERLIRRQRSREKRRWFYSSARQAAAVTMVFLLAIPVFSPTARAAIENLVMTTETYLNGTEYRFQIRSLPEDTEFVEAQLTYLPEGMELESVDRDEDELGGPYVYYSYGKSGEREYYYFNFCQELATEEKGGRYLASTREEMKVITIRGRKAMKFTEEYLIAQQTYTSIVWVEDHYLFTVSGILSEKELIKVAEGMVIQDQSAE